MTKKALVILALIIIVAVGVVYFKGKEAGGPGVSDKGNPVAGASKQYCYFKETTGEESTDSAFTSVNYGAEGKVSGIINWIPGEKDSLVGIYTGSVEKSDVPGYPTRLNIIYSGWGEGILSKQQEVIIVGAGSIKTGVGEKYQDADGVWKIKDTSALTYSNELPMVDCGIVPERIKADYSKTQ